LFKETVCILPSKAITAERLSLGVPELLPKPGNCSSQFFEKPLRNLLSAAKGPIHEAGRAGREISGDNWRSGHADCRGWRLASPAAVTVVEHG
jgi:hypothetical protein